MLSLDDVRAAAQRLHGVANRTPIITSRTLDELVGSSVFLKAECFQRTGAFKFRGAFNSVASLDEEERQPGVVAYSSGNHGQAVALSASLHGVPSTIVMPSDAPAGKLAATRGYGAEVVEYDRYGEDRAAIAAAVASEHGRYVIPPFDHWPVMAGAGTTALELFDSLHTLDTLIAPVGGGGLISGCSTVAKALGATRVVGVEPESGNDVQQSLASGSIVTIETPKTIADGQQTTAPSERTFSVIRERVDEIVLVTDDEIVAAMRFAFERLKIVLEPSGATGLAAVLAHKSELVGKKVGVLLTGGNVDLETFTQLLSR
jgi:threonine dehydratase